MTPTPDITRLRSLLERCEAAEGPDARLNAELTCAFVLKGLRPAEPDDFDGKYGYSPSNIKTESGFLMAHFYTRSVDECIELIGTTLPGAGWNLTGNTNLFYGMVSGAAGKGRPTPALALLSALLKALIAREEQRAGEEKEG